MEILSLGGADEANTPAPKSRKKISMLLGIGALAAITGIGSTLAANISLNGGGNVEFGQGVATTAACDDDITLTPISEFSNTYYESTFAMTAIQISGIDLTPEGWDVAGNQFAAGFDLVTGTWTTGYEEYSGQYKNFDGVWTNTCANKSIMVRGYTDNSAYANRTVDYSISSPLLLNGDMGQRPNRDMGGVGGNNPGVGFRYQTFPSVGWISSSWNIADCDWDCEPDPLDLDITPDANDGYEYSTVTIFLDDDSDYPPLDSRWVDKLTVESAATTPSGWADFN